MIILFYFGIQLLAVLLHLGENTKLANLMLISIGIAVRVLLWSVNDGLVLGLDYLMIAASFASLVCGWLREPQAEKPLFWTGWAVTWAPPAALVILIMSLSGSGGIF